MMKKNFVLGLLPDCKRNFSLLWNFIKVACSQFFLRNVTIDSGVIFFSLPNHDMYIYRINSILFFEEARLIGRKIRLSAFYIDSSVSDAASTSVLFNAPTKFAWIDTVDWFCNM